MTSGVDQLPSGKYRARYRCTGCPDHRDKPGQHSATFDRARDAAQWRTKQLASVHAGKHVSPNGGRVHFQTFATSWLEGQAFDRSTHDAVEARLRLHVFPTLGRMELRSITPSHVRAWLAALPGAANTKRTIFVNVSSIFSAAVDDELITRNTCKVQSVKSPKVEHRKVIPWPVADVLALHDALPERFQIVSTIAAGLGLRQGEVFGLSPDDVDWLRGKVEIRRQIKIVGSRLVFALPKGNKTRTVPLPSAVREELAAYLKEFPAKTVALPWSVPEGKAVEVPLILTTRESKPLNKNYVNAHVWKPALTKCGIETSRDNGMHALRHFFASVLLDAGESIKAVSEYLGHSDPGFTLRTYTHLMPTSDERSRKAIDAVLLSRVTDVSPAAESGV